MQLDIEQYIYNFLYIYTFYIKVYISYIFNSTLKGRLMPMLKILYIFLCIKNALKILQSNNSQKEFVFYEIFV